MIGGVEKNQWMRFKKFVAVNFGFFIKVAIW